MTERILIAEDDPAIADSVGYSLRACGYHVDVVSSGEAVLESGLASYDPLILDVMLPGLSGVEVCRRVRERSAVPVLMLTALAGEADRWSVWRTAPMITWASRSRWPRWSALGATLRLQDNPGGGTIATLTLPHARPASARMLVIEDEHAIRDAITYTLQADGYQVTEAATGQDGLSAARQERFDLIIIDMLLPDIPGTDLTRQLRGDGDGTRILAITAHAGIGTRDLALSAGADQFMTKPFAMNELLEQARALTSDRAS
jgi:DNA-binding response OmpR family regulator